MSKWLIVVLLAVVGLTALSQILLVRVLSEKSEAPANLETTVVERVRDPEPANETASVARLSHAEASLTNRVAPVREEPLKSSILPQ